MRRLREGGRSWTAHPAICKPRLACQRSASFLSSARLVSRSSETLRRATSVYATAGLAGSPTGGYAYSAANQIGPSAGVRQSGTTAKAKLFGKCLRQPRRSGEARNFALSCSRKPPMQAFLDGFRLAREKSIQAQAVGQGAPPARPILIVC